MVNAFLLANKYTTLRADEINKLAGEFDSRAPNGTLEKTQVKGVIDILDEKLAEDDVIAKLGELKLNSGWLAEETERT